MNCVFIDLTKREKGCTRTPVVRLVSGLSGVGGGCRVCVRFF